MAFKMKGSPMQRNFGIGGPLKKDKTKFTDKVKAAVETVKDTFSSSYDLGDIPRNYQMNKALIRKANKEGKKVDFGQYRKHDKDVTYD
tara:strand:+ start:341 stop:604 length:264 start_codon:yes stop_codon:yes gene_type:complete